MSDGLLLLLDMLWTRAEDVPYKPQYRVAVHWTLILPGFGFGPGSLMKFCYKNIRLLAIRDPETGRNHPGCDHSGNPPDEKRRKEDPPYSSAWYCQVNVCITSNAFDPPLEPLDEPLSPELMSDGPTNRIHCAGLIRQETSQPLGGFFPLFFFPCA